MTQFHKTDDRFMRVALQEAAKGLGQTSPNPVVGAVLVRKGRILSKAYHRGAGKPHAEVECICRICSHAPAARSRRTAHTAVATTPLAGSTLYVTLEPCSTIGRTGPCTKEIAKAGIGTVVIGAIDPNPVHRGRGIVELENAGIEVRAGILEAECAALNEAFNKWIVTQRPFVIAKCGMSLDGRLTRAPGEPQWLTSQESRRHARKLRDQVDAILVGAETVRADDPRLTVRDARKSRQPLLVVLTRSGKLPKAARIFEQRTAIYRDQSLESVLGDLGSKKITSVLIEGGGEILGQALDRRLIDKIQVYVAPMLTGGPVLAFPGEGAASTAEALRLKLVSYTKIGSDVCVTGYPAGE